MQAFHTERVASDWMTTPVGSNTMINTVQADHCAPSNTEPLPIRDSSRFRHGSLPFKKRRLSDAIPLWEWQVNNKMQVPFSPRSISGSLSENPAVTSSAPNATVAQATTSAIAAKSFDEKCISHEKIAVLAFVAAATAGSTVESPVDKGCVSPPNSSDTLENGQELSVVAPKVLAPKKATNTSPTETSNKTNTIDKEGIVRPNGRIHHPPLSNPLPNGCHGRTSRNNSYCRRQPCYNGSKYCKLHYQHYVITGIRPLDDTEAPTTCNPVEGNNSAATPTTSAPEVAASSGQQLQQDKRFTGCDDELRCEATTTRGRACAYVAVQGTKYCYLHADYDTNPPPRRGGGLHSIPNGKLKITSNNLPLTMTSSTLKPVSVVGTQRMAALPESENMAPAFVKSAYSSYPPSVTSEESYAPSLTCQQVAFEESAEAHEKGKLMDGPYPLLSTISPDQWHGKIVQIGTGPLVGRTGIVEKWGNGWVGVRVSIGTGGMADPHLHNRRALELYLLPDHGETALAEAHFDANDNALLRRCVSREADAAESKELMDSIKESEEDRSYSLKQARSQNCTPCFPNGLDRETHNIKYDNGALDAQQGTMIPESPMTPAHGMSNVDFSFSSCNFIPRSDEPPADSSCFYATGSVAAATVTPKPTSPRKVREDEELPLVQSLILAQGGGTRKNNLDLLFGTAALERSRRTVHKPQRYEDKAMLVRKRIKEGEADGLSPKRSSP